jgi:hypothetical protein
MIRGQVFSFYRGAQTVEVTMAGTACPTSLTAEGLPSGKIDRIAPVWSDAGAFSTGIYQEIATDEPQ